jgi:hypothetical protein
LSEGAVGEAEQNERGDGVRRSCNETPGHGAQLLVFVQAGIRATEGDVEVQLLLIGGGGCLARAQEQRKDLGCILSAGK